MRGDCCGMAYLHTCLEASSEEIRIVNVLNMKMTGQWTDANFLSREFQ
jgi:hypothetical protein